jgi:hypothetical protein
MFLDHSFGGRLLSGGYNFSEDPFGLPRNSIREDGDETREKGQKGWRKVVFPSFAAGNQPFSETKQKEGVL